jgi:hypothetical protein
MQKQSYAEKSKTLHFSPIKKSQISLHSWLIGINYCRYFLLPFKLLVDDPNFPII